MKRLLVLILFFPVLGVSSDTGITIPITTNNYIEEAPEFYHLGAKDSVTYRGLQETQRYMLIVGFNYASAYQILINFTAISTNVKVDFKISEIPFGSTNIGLALYKIINNTDTTPVLIETVYCQILRSEDNVVIKWVTNNLIIIGLAATVSSFLIIFIRRR